MVNTFSNAFLRVFLSMLLLAGCLAAGVYVSQVKPLWNDEIFTQAEGVEVSSYQEILLGRLGEGNNCPLFYMLQKAQSDFFGYRLPFQWNGEWNVHEPYSQLFLRALPNLYMSLPVMVFFVFFWRVYSFPAALYILVVIFSSPMVWSYWAEARPYGLWFLLTALQSVFLARCCQNEQGQRRLIWGLAGVHLLLSLTITLSVVQIVAGVIVLLFFCHRELRKHILAAVAPGFLGLYYYLHSPRFKLWFADGGMMPLVYDNVPVDRMVLMGICAGLALYLALQRTRFSRDDEFPVLWGERSYLFYAVLMGIISAGILGFLKLIDEGGPEGFTVSSRYFIFLTPVAIMATGMLTVSLWRALKDNTWMRWNFAIVVAGLSVMRILQLYVKMMKYMLK